LCDLKTDQRLQEQRQQPRGGGRLVLERECGLSIKLFHPLGADFLAGYRNAASAKADTRLLDALNSKTADQAHNSRSPQQHARTAIELRPIFMDSTIPKHSCSVKQIFWRLGSNTIRNLRGKLSIAGRSPLSILTVRFCPSAI